MATQWEYKTFPVRVEDDPEVMLNAAGAEGWELVAVTPAQDDYVHGYNDDYATDYSETYPQLRYVFKRKKIK